MAVLSVESAAITKSRLKKGFNGDNVNLFGRPISIANANNGFKTTVTVKPPYSTVIASGNQNGFAHGATSAFCDYIKKLHAEKENAEYIIHTYFDDMENVVSACNIEGSSLSLGLISVYNDRLIAARTGGCHLLRYTNGDLFEIALSEETEEQRGEQRIDSLQDGDIFALISEEAARDLDYNGIIKAFESGEDLKSVLHDLFRVLYMNAIDADCTVVLMRIHCDADPMPAAAPILPDATDRPEALSLHSDEFDAEPPIHAEELDDSAPEIPDSETPVPGKRKSRRKLANILSIAVLIIILAVAAALYLATRPSNPRVNGEKESGTAGDSVFLADSTDANDDFNGSSGMLEVKDTEQGGDANVMTTASNASERETTTRYTEQATTKAPEPTTPEPTTSAPVTAEPTTPEPTTETPIDPDDPESPGAPDENEAPEVPDTPVDNEETPENSDEGGELV